MKLLYKIQKSLFRFIGDIKWGGITHPFWFTVNAMGYRLKGEHYRTVINLIQPGDILIRRFEGYIDKWFIPGWWNHCGIYVGEVDGKPEQIIHAVSEGVIQEDFLNFMRTDHMMMLRLKDPDQNPERIKQSIQIATSIVGKPYDFGFDFKHSNRFSCTELVAYCYPGIIRTTKRLGKQTIIADDFANANTLTTVWDSTKDNSVASMRVVESF